MAIVIVNEMEGGTQDLYDEITPKVMSDNQLPDGCQLHVAGPIENGWRVITVWDSEEQFQQFRDEKLIPALQEAGSEDRITPNISTGQVHRVMIA